MAWRLRATRLAMGGAAGIVSASFANCNTATQTDAASKLKSTLSSGSPPISVAPDHMLFAIPKKGRLNEKIVSMLKGSGFDYSRPERLDIAHCKDLPVSIVFLPASDIATYVAEGNVDLGITGEDMIEESGAKVNLLMKLGFGKCRLSVQAPKGQCEDVRKLAGHRIATSFPELTKKFFAQHENGKPTRVKVISGSVEASCGLGLADGIVDLVETGTTMRAAGLEVRVRVRIRVRVYPNPNPSPNPSPNPNPNPNPSPNPNPNPNPNSNQEVAVLMDTQAVLISNPKTAYPELVETVRRRLAGYQTAQRFVMCTYNVHRDNLNEVRATPAATVAPAPHRHRAGSATPPAPRRQRRRVARPSALTAEARPQARVAEPLVTAPAPRACPSRLPASSARLPRPGEQHHARQARAVGHEP